MMRAVLAVDEREVAGARAGHEWVRQQLQSWRSGGLLVQDQHPGFYLYRRTDEQRVVVGLIGAISLHPARHRVVVPHEGVDPVMVGRQASLMAAFQGQPEPVVTVHRGSVAFRAEVAQVLSGQPQFIASTDAVVHELWHVWEASTVARVCDELAGGSLLLADGHHRYAAFQRLRDRLGGDQEGENGRSPWDLGLAMLVDEGETGLSLGPIHRVLPRVDHRVVAATPGLRVDAGRQGPCLLTDGHRWWTLAPEPLGSRTPNPPWPELIVSLLHREWLPHWGVADSQVAYVHDAHDAVAQADAAEGLALLLPSPTLDAVFDAAASGNLMPAKATSFQPKPLIGLVMRHWPERRGDL